MKNTVIILLALILLVSLANLLGTFGVFGGGSGAAKSGAQYEYAVYSVDEIGAMVLKLIEEEEGIRPDAEGRMTMPRAALLPQNSLPRVMNYMGRQGWELVEIKPNGLHFFRRQAAAGLPSAPRLIPDPQKVEAARASAGASSDTPAPAVPSGEATPTPAPAQN